MSELMRRQDGVYILDLGDGENRFNPDSLAALGEALQQVMATPPPRALLTEASGPKFWSNGLDLAWINEHPARAQDTLHAYHVLMAEWLEASVPTVAAIGGHAFAAGAIFACAHDAIVMRADRGFWCVPEADLQMPFSPGMNAILTARLPRRTAHEAMTSGRRYGGHEALAAGIIDEAVAEDDVLPTALARAATLANKHPDTLGAIKSQLHADTIKILRTPHAI